MEEKNFEKVQRNFRCEACQRNQPVKGSVPTESLTAMSAMMKEMQEKINTLHEELAVERQARAEIEARLEIAEEKLSLKGAGGEEMKEAIREEAKREAVSYAAKLKKNLQTEPGKVILKTVANLQERKLNVVFRGVEELRSEAAEDRKEHDLRMICAITGEAGVEEEEMKKCLVMTRRLGKKEEDKVHRPLLVKLTSQELRERLLKGNKHLRNTNKRNGTRYRIDPDLTKDQMARLDNLWETARSKTAESKNGLKFYVVGMENPELRSTRVEERMEEKKAEE